MNGGVLEYNLGAVGRDIWPAHAIAIADYNRFGKRFETMNFNTSKSVTIRNREIDSVGRENSRPTVGSDETMNVIICRLLFGHVFVDKCAMWHVHTVGRYGPRRCQTPTHP